jgi:hypothetical protein
MFEKATTLAELNKMRAEAMTIGKDMHSIREINSAYNSRKKEICSVKVPFKTVPIHRPNYEDTLPIIYLPHAGKTTRKNTIELTPEGFKF